MDDVWGFVNTIKVNRGRVRFIDTNAFRSIKAALDNWEGCLRGAEEPDEVLTKYLSETREGTEPKWPDKYLMKEVMSVLSNIEDPSIVKFLRRNYGMAEREAFWLCLGLVLGGKVAVELFSSGIKNMDKAVSVD